MLIFNKAMTVIVTMTVTMTVTGDSDSDLDSATVVDAKRATMQTRQQYLC